MSKKRMPKRKSPTEILEADSNPEFEAGLVKVRGGDYHDFRERKDTGSTELTQEYKDKNIKGKPYTMIHTHPRLERDTKVEDPSVLVDPEYRRILKMDEEDIEQSRADVGPSFPSQEDLVDVLSYKNKRSSIVGQRDPITGNVAGYFVIRKTKNVKNLPTRPEGKNVTDKQEEKWFDSPEVQGAYDYLQSLGYYQMPKKGGPRLTPEQLDQNEKALKAFASKYGLQIRPAAAKGYSYQQGLGFVKDQKGSKLEKIARAAAAVGIIGGISLLSPIVTGNSIGNLPNTTTNMVGLFLIVLGLIFAYSCKK